MILSPVIFHPLLIFFYPYSVQDVLKIKNLKAKQKQTKPKQKKTNKKNPKSKKFMTFYRSIVTYHFNVGKHVRKCFSPPHHIVLCSSHGKMRAKPTQTSMIRVMPQDST